jgi:hypothetical protein
MPKTTILGRTTALNKDRLTHALRIAREQFQQDRAVMQREGAAVPSLVAEFDRYVQECAELEELLERADEVRAIDFD